MGDYTAAEISVVGNITDEACKDALAEYGFNAHYVGGSAYWCDEFPVGHEDLFLAPFDENDYTYRFTVDAKYEYGGISITNVPGVGRTEHTYDTAAGACVPAAAITRALAHVYLTRADLQRALVEACGLEVLWAYDDAWTDHNAG